MNPLIPERVEKLLKQMTLEEKIGQMSQVRHFDDIQPGDVKRKFIGSVIHTQGPVPGLDASAWQEKFILLQKEALSTRLQIPLFFGVDAVHGQNTYEGATIFPHNIGLGASRNVDLIEKIARITALESRATGFQWVFSPCVAVPFNEKWGRVYEAFSEDPELTSLLSKASISGHQNATNHRGVMATAKHFIGDGATDFGREGGNATLDKSELISRLLPPYEAAIEAGVGSIMASFNTLDGIPMHAHKALLTDLLKEKLNFDGILVSDWKAYSRFGGNEIVNAGIDMVMAVDGDLDLFQNGLKAGVENGKVSIKRIDDAVRRILTQKFRFGLFDQPFPDRSLITQIGTPSHRSVARQAVRESLVLLKNEKALLPLNRKSKIAVVGEMGNNSGLQSGGWTINWQGTTDNYTGATTILEGIRKFSDSEVYFDPDGKTEIPSVDLAIIVVGESPYAEFFGDIGGEMNNYQHTLTLDHQALIQTYSDRGIPIVIILITGRPLVVRAQIDQSEAFVVAWLPGSEGDGIAEVLFGQFDFLGKLPHTWPDSLENYEGRFGPNFWDDTCSPIFPMGFGLRYFK
ncbi:glycoside hydrolase family 3 protein [Belliella kenyensis]|uniref:beta-glucosidase n=1 Tax=Belliella kenyensis TaxID=1472724 RepID=A0ABV8EJ77_9BACT|nr:glycoside hydrolase family 3 N-terminal domain-containing protein [Belliella kenyensis]MCH7400422.1 glycoside hydrolase family 3 C-terminal domain-containing protein [Belliella kenyensis]MDN3604561.1 glycoside hydrolase family 3 N-terminal domain-containing protein [Belliella kenyensis]